MEISNLCGQLDAPKTHRKFRDVSGISVIFWGPPTNFCNILIIINNNKRPLTPKSMPPAGDEHAKLKTIHCAIFYTIKIGENCHLRKTLARCAMCLTPGSPPGPPRARAGCVPGVCPVPAKSATTIKHHHAWQFATAHSPFATAHSPFAAPGCWPALQRAHRRHRTAGGTSAGRKNHPKEMTQRNKGLKKSPPKHPKKQLQPGTPKITTKKYPNKNLQPGTQKTFPEKTR